MERKHLIQYLTDHKKGAPLESKIFVLEDSIEFYKPIFLGMDACLKCHGAPGTQIAEETLKKIKEHYPEDLATGFELNDFRGAWKVTFKR